jgi:RHS repeat-associated protein
VETSTDGLRTWNTIWNNGTAVTSQARTAFDAANGYRYVTNIAPDSSYSVAITRYGTNVSLTRFDSLNNQLSSINYSYDAHGRQNTVTDARTGTTTYTFNDADQVVTVTTPDPGNGAQVTTNYYDSMGRIWKTTLPDNTSVTNEYFLTGQLKKTYGSRTYPVEYSYDSQGRMKTMKTWQNFAGDSGTAMTTWNYDIYRGWLTNKTYDGGAAGPAYTYTSAGKLKSRVWARGITTTYSYNNAGDLSTVSYSDGTVGVTNGYNRLGRLAAVTNGTAVCAFTYNNVGQLLSEAYSAGPLAGLTVTNGYDNLLRRSAVAVSNIAETVSRYGYDAASRLAAVTNGTLTASYGYLANSPLIEMMNFKDNGNTRLTVSNRYDALNRLSGKLSTASGGATFGFDYAYNSSNQRTAITNEDAARWQYQYDSLGQVTSGKRFWSDGTNVAGQQFEYAFDDVGNRKWASFGGDQYGASLREGFYTNNSLNQITSRTIPGFANVLGSAATNATVTVNDQATYRHDEYFRAELSVTNDSAPVWQGVTNVAVVQNGTNEDIVASATVFVFVAQSPEVFGYDADGNLKNDGRWNFTWDAENRLTKAESLSGGPTASKRKVEWSYDYRGRRVRQTSCDGSSGSYVATEDLKLVYDGWRCLAELNATNGALVRSYVWGLDLSGTIGGAGGVGGLLALNSVANGTHCYAYDGNGNVAGLVSASDGGESARYEYEPFGRTLRASGTVAIANPFRFSTKRANDTTDFVLYEYRAYIPSLGGWLNRDPLEEAGGLDLDGFLANSPLGRIDPDGRWWPDGPYGVGGPPIPSRPRPEPPYNWETPGSIPSQPGAYGPFYPPPNWFDHPVDEGKPCCCKPPATLKAKRADLAETFRIQMKLDLELTGCYKDLVILWRTCWRYLDNGPFGTQESGVITDYINQTSATFTTYGNAYVTTAKIRYLSCENGKWAKKVTQVGRGYSRTSFLHNWTWADTTKDLDD